MLGLGLGMATARKAIFKLVTDGNAFYNFYQDYKTSNTAVSNNPKKIMTYKFVSVVLLIILFSCKDVNKFSAGSYPYAEVYEITLPKEDVIHKIDSIKNNEKLQVPPFEWAGKETFLQDKALENGYFIFYIFLKESNQIIYSYIRETNLKETRIGLVKVQNGLSLGSWKEINKDLSEEEDERLQKIFEEKIISKIN